MGNYVGNIIICVLVVLSIGVIYGTTQIVKSLTENQHELLNSGSYNWIIRLSLNLLGYTTILLPGYLVYKYVRHSKYLQRAGTGVMSKLVHRCISGGGESGLLDTTDYIPASKASQEQRFIKNETFLLLYCFSGLQISYLTWGYFQEKIMTQEYVNSIGEKEHFKDSQFLVFVNRILAFTISGLYLIIRKQPRHITPLYKYSYCSLSNILSSWCQYEALKFVSFPTQVLAKASKIIPVMIMGKLVSRKTYEYYEYVTASLISLGMTLFMLGSTETVNDKVTTISGVILLAGYMVLDSFTSNWQEAVSKEYGPTSIQMMCGVNLFSCLLTATSLLQQSGFTHSLYFLIKFPSFLIDCLLISICSATGQLFLFYTIAQFGAVTFSIIMTIRQGLAILLSCLIYQHQITIFGIIGIFIVFGSIFLRNYCRNRLRALKKHRAENINIKD
ncbi:GSCOCG00008449001-RA-CDS [Cotesia congregata]|uniref:Adenosine 3'-phospho 5'-phosphosulfate transporter 1 n=1 Tax=Cotesia congregata TaxID=51543 RepID=A0A8J2MVW3_COTCN|nr:GSCOCG00008449001-RA-CDS [Cotesia congregata]CAG5099867.1 Similar to sll: Adenosine 3'-phospho 5'-phosphosulfate transporter 1 (Drosophila melanogaster) [Cotesia congregata]